MGTHPIFESDFDCLTETKKKMSGIGGQSNTMSSINRPTSRVLAPPGGGSSNIFGAMSDPTPAPSNSSRTGRSNEQSCNIFGQPVVEHKQPVKQAAAAPTPAAAAAPTPSAPAARAAQPPTNENNGINPKRPSTKVHAPPGGHSSISF